MLERMLAAWDKAKLVFRGLPCSEDSHKALWMFGFQAGVEAQKQADREWLEGALTSGDESGEHTLRAALRK